MCIFRVRKPSDFPANCCNKKLAKHMDNSKRSYRIRCICDGSHNQPPSPVISVKTTTHKLPPPFSAAKLGPLEPAASPTGSTKPPGRPARPRAQQAHKIL